MKTRWFLVIIARGEWWVDCEGKSFGPFDSALSAVSGAIRYAEVFSDAGRQSQVWAPDDTGRMYQAWSSGPLAPGGEIQGLRNYLSAESKPCVGE